MADQDARLARIHSNLSIQNGYPPGYAHAVAMHVGDWQCHKTVAAADATAVHLGKRPAAQEEEVARFRVAEGGQAMALREARVTIFAMEKELAGKKRENERLRLVNKKQARELAGKQEQLLLRDSEIAQLRKEARPGVEVLYVDEGVTRIEGEGQGEPAAKRLKATEDGAARSYAELGEQFKSRLFQVKQVPAQGP